MGVGGCPCSAVFYGHPLKAEMDFVLNKWQNSASLKLHIIIRSVLFPFDLHFFVSLVLVEHIYFVSWVYICYISQLITFLPPHHSPPSPHPVITTTSLPVTTQKH